MTIKNFCLLIRFISVIFAIIVSSSFSHEEAQVLTDLLPPAPLAYATSTSRPATPADPSFPEHSIRTALSSRQRHSGGAAAESIGVDKPTTGVTAFRDDHDDDDDDDDHRRRGLFADAPGVGWCRGMAVAPQ